jgi:hypothetical protein
VEPDDGVMEETVVPFDADRETLVDSSGRLTERGREDLKWSQE